MIRDLLVIGFALSLPVHSFSQSVLGEVGCIYITSGDLDSSEVQFEKFGFTKIASNTFPVPWVQLTDGNLLLMIRKDPQQYTGLTYYSSDAESVAGKLENEGFQFIQKPKEGDAIKRYQLRSPDGVNITIASNLGGFRQPLMSNMLTMKPEDLQNEEKYANKQCGVFGEFCQPVADLTVSIEYWKKLGFELKSKMDAPYPMAILSDGKLLIGLHQTDHFNFSAISYFGVNTEKRVQQLKEKGITDIKKVSPGNFVITTKEGLKLFLFSFGM